MCYWNGGVPKDFLGGEILRGSKGVEQEQNRPLLWSVKGTSFLIQMCLVLGILKDEFEVWKTWIFIIGLNWVGVFETQLVFFFLFLSKRILSQCLRLNHKHVNFHMNFFKLSNVTLITSVTISITKWTCVHGPSRCLDNGNYLFNLKKISFFHY